VANTYWEGTNNPVFRGDPCKESCFKKRIDTAYPKAALGRASYMNGKPGDHPITDITKYKLPRFSPTADALIAEIVQLGAREELEKAFNLFAPPPLASFESGLRQLRDRVFAERKASGWEV
jgi:hypothetical protein